MKPLTDNALAELRGRLETRMHPYGDQQVFDPIMRDALAVVVEVQARRAEEKGREKANAITELHDAD